MPGAGLGRGLATPLLVTNFVLYLVAACLAGWALNRNFDAQRGQGEGGVGNNVTQNFFLPITLVACMVGLASILAGLHHMRLFRSDSLAAAAATSLIAWLLVLLAMGLACKQIHTGGNRPKRLRVVEAFMIILAIFELLYLLSLHLGFGRAGHKRGGAPIATGAGTGTGVAMGGYNHGGSPVGTGAGTGTGIGTGTGTGTGTGIGTGTGVGVGGHNHNQHTDFGHHSDTKIPVGHVANPAHSTY